MPPTVTELSSALIAVFEGPAKLTAYRDSGGVWTIGQGHTRGVQPGQTCTAEQSIAWFAEDQASLLTLVAGLPLVAAAAYASFGYNCGRYSLHAVLIGADTVGNPLHTTDKHGNVQPGLVSRRKLEQLLIETALPPVIPVPKPSGIGNATADGEGLVGGGR